MATQGVEQLAVRFREVVALGSTCFSLLMALTQGKILEQVVELEGRKYRISAQAVPIRIEIEPMDH